MADVGFRGLSTPTSSGSARENRPGQARMVGKSANAETGHRGRRRDLNSVCSSCIDRSGGSIGKPLSVREFLRITRQAPQGAACRIRAVKKSSTRYMHKQTGLSQIPRWSMLRQVSMVPSDECVMGIRIVRRPTHPHGEQFGQHSDLSNCSRQGSEARPLAVCPHGRRVAASPYRTHRLGQDRRRHSRVGSTPLTMA